MSSSRRRMMMAANAGGSSVDTIIMTVETNPEVLSICYSKGWCASDQYMTASEAAAVTTIGTTFRDKTAITHFEEFEYFTGISRIDETAFRACTNIRTIKLPQTITRIYNSAFQNCNKLESIEFPSGLTNIGTLCFYQCPKLLTITSHATTAPTITSSTFLNMSQHGTLYVPTGSDYSTWMSTGNNYLGKYNWTKVEF